MMAYDLEKVLKIHIIANNPGEKHFKCNQCNYACAQSGNLQQHMMTHSGEKPFKCNKCSKAYTRKYLLAKHSRIHTTKISIIL